MAYTEDFHGNDASLDRTIKLANNVVHIRRHDPYGFWHVSYERGGVPLVLSGAYTSYEDAHKAVMVYLQANKKEVVS